MMLKSKLSFTLIAFVLILFSCDSEEPTPQKGPHPSHKSIPYYPVGKNFNWEYSITKIDNGDMARWVESDGYDYYYGWIVGSYRKPYLDMDGQVCGNSGLCAFGGHIVIARFSTLQGTEDSVLLSDHSWPNASMISYQFRKAKTIPEANNYQGVKCKKSLLITYPLDKSTDLDSIYNYRYFGRSQGLVKQEIIAFKRGGKTRRITKVLTSHNF